MANSEHNQKAAAQLQALEQTLGVTPIIIGHRTAFERTLFKPAALVLSLRDFVAARTGQIARVSYIVNHELCHKISGDILLSYLIKIITMFNCVLIALLYSYFTFVMFSLTLEDISPLLNILVIYGIGYVYYRLLISSYYDFSRFKEHLADEYALLNQLHERG